MKRLKNQSFSLKVVVLLRGSLLRLMCFYFLFPVLPSLQTSQNFTNPIILDKAKGLDVGQIIDVIEDNNGFLWIGGLEGLQRFDGLNFMNYESVEGDEYSFQFDGISNLFYDEEENQILVSGKGYKNGHRILDLATEKFNDSQFGEPLDSLFKSNGVTWVYKDNRNNYWFRINEKGLFKYSSNTKSTKPYFFNSRESEKKLNFSTANDLRSYSPDQTNDSLLWMGGATGLIKFNMISGEYDRFPIDKNHGNGFNIRTVFHHDNNIVYIGTWGEGLFAFDPNSAQLIRCNIDINIGPKRKYNIVKINPHSKNKIWVTHVLGLFLYDTAENKVENYWLDDVAQKKEYTIRNFSKEHQRQFGWRNTEIFIFDDLRQQVQSFDFPETDMSLIVRGILEDKGTGMLWIAAQGSKGIYRLDLKTEEWELFSPPQSFSDKHPTFNAWDILQTKDGEILVLDANGIFTISKKNKKLVPWKHQSKIAGRSFRRFIEDKDGNIWIGTRINGLYRINTKNGKTRHFYSELMNEEKLKPGSITDLKEDRNGNIWIRSSGYGVYVPNIDTLYNFPYFFKEIKKVLHISSLGQDGNGDVWIGSGERSIGITNANNPELGIVKYIDGNSGLKTKYASEFHLDINNDMWIMSNGLERLSAKNKSTLFLDPSYMPESSLWSISQLSNGNIAVGFKKGIGIFNPRTIKGPSKELQPYIHSFKVFDKRIKIDTPLISAKDIYLKPNHNYFSFEISAKNRYYSGDIEFLYQLEGIDPEWINPGNRKYISYTNLNPGIYDFRLKARNNSGMWNSKPYKIKIHIAAPWYNTWWAYALLILSILSLLFYMYRLNLSKRIKEEETERLKEVDRFKTNFYSNITHEFRTPLTVILGMADSLKPSNQNSENRKALELIKGNGERLLRLVNEILGLAKAEKGKLTLNLLQGDIISFIKYIGESFHVSAAQKDINLTIYSEIEKLEMDFDADKVASIVSNLINNAIKFTPASGEIILHSNRAVKNNVDLLVFKVKDNGSGLSEEEKTYVFDKYYQANNALNQYQSKTSVYNNILNNTADGSGIGLSLTKEYVELLGGKIKVESQLGIGSVFIVELPISNKAPFSSSSPISVKNESLSIRQSIEEPVILEEKPSELPLVLIVEDDPGVAHYLKTCLKDKYAFHHAKNGNEGIEMALKFIPDIVISDIMMPEKNGLELCNTLKNEELTDHIPIILLTAKATIQDRLIGLAQGADAYLSKPFLKEELYTRLEQLIATRKRILNKVEKSSFDNVLNLKSDSSKAKFIDKAIKIILDNISDHGLGSAQLAHKLQLSESQVYRKIKASSNKSTAVFIRSIRLQKSKELLKSTDLSISEIAYDVGFNDPSWFSRVFKEEFGISPKSLRN